MSAKRVVSHAVFVYRSIRRTKSSVISIILFTLVLLFMFADSIFSNISLHSAAFHGKEDYDVLRTSRVVNKFKSHVLPVPLNVYKQRVIGVGTNSELSSLGVSEEEERIDEKSRGELPEVEILRSDELTKKFHGRVLEFFNQECEVQFFMTWISEASSFGAREILSVESVFNTHPHGCLMILSKTLDSVNGYRVLKPLLDRGFKVVAVTPDLPFLLKDTPAEAWFDDIKSGKKDPGEIPLAQNLSNLMRLAVLYRYGGIYLDTDFIVLKSFKPLKNTIGAQSVDGGSRKWTRLNNAVLIFDINHPLLFKFMEEFALTFDGNKWGHNGPYMVSRVVQRVEGRPGYNFTILPPMAFYPVDWNKIGSLFKVPKALDQGGSKWVEAKLVQLSRESYGVHLWNKQSSKMMVEQGSVMGRLISHHCVLCKRIYSS